jgi:hemolysin activation/secretion protein
MSDRQTLAFQLRGDWGVRLLPQDAITLGAESGLRGFDAYDFWGERAAVMNLEDRVTLAEDFLGLVSVGMSAFADVGSIWRAGHRDEARLRVAAGLGLRVLSSRTSRRVATRIDAGLPLIGAEDHAGFIVSIGSDPDF